MTIASSRLPPATKAGEREDARCERSWISPRHRWGLPGIRVAKSSASKKRTHMKLVIIGGTGLIGSKLVMKLREQGPEPAAAAPETGVNTLSSEGLAEALQGASVVVDVSNSPSFEEAAVMEFFTTSTRNLLKFSAADGVGQYGA